MATTTTTVPTPNQVPPVITPEMRTEIAAAIKSGYRETPGLTFAGFSINDLAQYFFGGTSNVQRAEAEAVIRGSQGLKQTVATQSAALLIGTKRLKGDISWGLQHLQEHPKGSHYSGDFNIGNFISNTAGILTFGAFPDLRSFFSALGQGRFDIGKIQFNVPFSGAHINKYTHDVVGFYSGQQLESQATPILDSHIAQLLDTIAGATAGAITGGAAFQFGALTPAATAGEAAGEVAVSSAPQLIGVTQASLDAVPIFSIGETANYVQAGVTAESLAQAGITEGGIFATLGNGAVAVGKFVGGSIAAAYIQKVISGGTKAATDLLRGNVTQAFQDLVGAVDPTGNSGPQARTQGASFGGGGGGAYGGGQGYGTAQQNSLLSMLLPLGLVVGAVVLAVYFYKRRK
jgi:hypothetical protein